MINKFITFILFPIIKTLQHVSCEIKKMSKFNRYLIFIKDWEFEIVILSNQLNKIYIYRKK